MLHQACGSLVLSSCWRRWAQPRRSRIRSMSPVACRTAFRPLPAAVAENPNTNPDTGNPVYTDNGLSGYTSAKASGAAVADKPVTPGSRYFSTAFTNSSNPTYGIAVNPSLAVPGAVYRVDHTFSAAAGNIR